MIGQAKDIFVPISSFFLESLLKNRPEKFRESKNFEFSFRTFKKWRNSGLVDKIGFIPCNRSHHWSLIVIFHKQKTILLFDSMGNFTDLGKFFIINIPSHTNVRVPSVYQRPPVSSWIWTLKDTLLLLNKLRSHLNNLYNMKFKVMIHKKVRSQSNSDDCGVFGKSSQWQ